MPVICPCCRAANDAGPACRRCKADLSLLFAVADRRGDLVSAARRHAAAGQYPDALAALDEAEWLRAGDDVRRVRAAVFLLAGEFPDAWAAYHGQGAHRPAQDQGADAPRSPRP